MPSRVELSFSFFVIRSRGTFVKSTEYVLSKKDSPPQVKKNLGSKKFTVFSVYNGFQSFLMVF